MTFKNPIINHDDIDTIASVLTAIEEVNIPLPANERISVLISLPMSYDQGGPAPIYLIEDHANDGNGDGTCHLVFHEGLIASERSQVDKILNSDIKSSEYAPVKYRPIDKLVDKLKRIADLTPTEVVIPYVFVTLYRDGVPVFLTGVTLYDRIRKEV